MEFDNLFVESVDCVSIVIVVTVDVPIVEVPIVEGDTMGMVDEKLSCCSFYFKSVSMVAPIFKI